MTPLRAARQAALLALATLPGVSACGDSGDFVGPDDGSFQASVAGGFARTLRGFAYFGTTAGSMSEPSYFILELAHEPENENEQPFGIFFVRDIFGLPLVTSYTLTFAETLDPPPEQFAGFLMAMQGIQSVGTFSSTEGTLTFNSVDANQLQGTFSFSARGAFDSQPAEQLTVSVQGNFRAVRGSVIVPRFSR